MNRRRAATSECWWTRYCVQRERDNTATPNTKESLKRKKGCSFFLVTVVTSVDSVTAGLTALFSNFVIFMHE